MSNSPLSGAGDGNEATLTSLNGNSKAPPPWHDLLLPVFWTLGSKVDKKTLHTMRLVCSTWQSNVEEILGLKVKVNDVIPGNLEFIQRVKVTKAHVVNWTTDLTAEPTPFLFLYPGWLKTLKLSVKMPAQWRFHDLCQFPCLAHLVLRDDVLHLNNLSGHPYPIVKIDLASGLTLEEMVRRALQAQDPPTSPQLIVLRSLKTLEIVRSDQGHNGNASKHFLWLAVTNMCFVLRYVKAPLLSVAHLFLTQPQEIYESLQKLNWMDTPLEIFLKAHHTTLRDLFLPNIVTNGWETEDVDMSTYPTKLRKLKLSLLPRGGQPPAPETFTSIQRLIQEQRQLESVKLVFLALPTRWIQNTIGTLASSSTGHSLRYLEISFGSPPRDEQGAARLFDLGVLSICQNLEVLIVPGWGFFNHVIFGNADRLPTSIKTLILDDTHGGRIELGGEGQPSIFKRLRKLERVHVQQIQLPGNDLQTRRQVCRDMVKDLLGLRHLEGFYIQFSGNGLSEDTNVDEDVVTMFRSVDQGVKFRMRVSEPTFKFNLNYRSYGRNSWLNSPLTEVTAHLEDIADSSDYDEEDDDDFDEEDEEDEDEDDDELSDSDDEAEEDPDEDDDED